MELISISFDINKFNSQSARRYLVSHKFKPISRVEKSSNCLVYKMKNIDYFYDFNETKLEDDISVLIGKRKKIKKILIK